MQLILQIDETLVFPLTHWPRQSQNRTRKVRSEVGRRGIDVDFLQDGRRGERESWCSGLFEEDFQGAR